MIKLFFILSLGILLQINTIRAHELQNNTLARLLLSKLDHMTKVYQEALQDSSLTLAYIIQEADGANQDTLQELQQTQTLPYQQMFEEENINIDASLNNISKRTQQIFATCMVHHHQEIECSDLSQKITIYFELLHSIAKKRIGFSEKY